MPFELPIQSPVLGGGQKRFSFDEHFWYSDQPNMDVAENIFFRRELEHIIPEMFEFEFARINARRIFPIDRSADPTARTITWRQFTDVGQAQIIADYADDINIVNSKGEEFSTSVRGIAVAAQWSVQEIRAAQRHGKQLDRRFTEAARKTMMRLENSIAFNGDAAFNLQGLFTVPGIPQNAAPNGTWTQATPADDILEDMNFAANTIVESTGDVETPDTLLLPTTKYNIIASRKHGLDTDRTILSHFVLNNPYINEVIPVRELETAGPGSTPVMVAYERSPSKLRMQVPLDLEQFAPIQHNLVIKTIYHMRIGGVIVFKPLSIHKVTGI